MDEKILINSLNKTFSKVSDDMNFVYKKVEKLEKRVKKQARMNLILGSGLGFLTYCWLENDKKLKKIESKIDKFGCVFEEEVANPNTKNGIK